MFLILLLKLIPILNNFRESVSKGVGVMLFFYLGDGLFGSAFQFELHHVDVVRSFYHEVNPSFGRMIFCLGIETYQFEDNEEHVLVVPFQLARSFACKRVQGCL